MCFNPIKVMMKKWSDLEWYRSRRNVVTAFEGSFINIVKT